MTSDCKSIFQLVMNSLFAYSHFHTGKYILLLLIFCIINCIYGHVICRNPYVLNFCANHYTSVVAYSIMTTDVTSRQLYPLPKCHVF